MLINMIMIIVQTLKMQLLNKNKIMKKQDRSKEKKY